MTSIYHSPLRPKPGARARRVTPPAAPRRQPVTNAEWFERRAAERRQNPLGRLIGKLLGKGRANG